MDANKFLFINNECFDIDYLIEIIFLALAKRIMIERSFVVNGFLRSLIYLRANANFIKCFKGNIYIYEIYIFFKIKDKNPYSNEKCTLFTRISQFKEKKEI